MVITTMFGVLLMAAAIPTAFAGGGLLVASVYVAIQVLRHVWLVLLGGDREVRRATIRILFWALISAGPWLAGGFAHGDVRLAWWTVAIGLDYLGGALYFPTPGLGRAGHLRGRRLAAEHITERYRQVLIIAFGETILIDLASYAHVVTIAGIGVSAVGDELVITHPRGHTEPAWLFVIFGGPALFLIGRGILDYAVFCRVSRSRPIGLLVLGVAALAALWLPPVLAATSVVVVVAGVAVSNLVTWRWYPVRPVPPPNVWLRRTGR